MSYQAPRPIEPGDDTAGFDCGEPSLTTYLQRRALANHQQGGSRCYVSTTDGRIAGYYALAAGSVYHRDLPGRVRRNMPEPVPVVLLSRLAVDLRDHGRGLGAGLLQDAVLRTVTAADLIGVRALLVHAVDEQARSFCAHHGFTESPTDPLHLLLLLADARQFLE